jgi:uncharacterized protein
MKAFNLITLILIIIGGLNWGLMGIAHVDVVAALFGGPNNGVARAIYIIIGLCAVYQLAPFSKAASVGEVAAESGRDFGAR